MTLWSRWACIIVLAGCSGCVNVPQYRDVTQLDDGLLVLTRDSLEAFNAGQAVERDASEYCREQGLAMAVEDRDNSYINSAGEAKFRVTLTFRCVPQGSVAKPAAQ